MQMKATSGWCTYSQGTPTAASKPQKLGESHGAESPSQPPKESADTLIAGFWPPKL